MWKKAATGMERGCQQRSEVRLRISEEHMVLGGEGKENEDGPHGPEKFQDLDPLAVVAEASLVISLREYSLALVIALSGEWSLHVKYPSPFKININTETKQRKNGREYGGDGNISKIAACSGGTRSLADSGGLAVTIWSSRLSSSAIGSDCVHDGKVEIEQAKWVSNRFGLGVVVWVSKCIRWREKVAGLWLEEEGWRWQ
ncbi:hypothetical protein RIF29_30467 [Crotalaria pallida]|uniref:Uncharacterized protein n=1 Tax=Crotalaria pallida TaxID=3830 RepID=A0AAN9HY97_CROPI